MSTPKPKQTPQTSKKTRQPTTAKYSPDQREFLRAENEDDDGYDPYSDRRPTPEPLFERDPWT